ncbi:hypothetical protein OG777_24210 [Micromonospora peucetia]|uniref:Uncharacterized protein n=1 Tax=Micromonospora peucetia TaxID=47871 RepID=A0A1C6W4T3_9ACTN|nr:hypothetical protein [Micromonospora peucetia]MCX4390012.1 hypothetical protein [Micromonospora peucetia]WSA32684.1 hypothetical protein OIE14_00930 [Micromonospora peucetia]SCL73543.1 hypothetical protein GA0070608_5837 [Micromonospora peucetia]
MTKNRRTKTRFRLQQAATGTNYLEARRQVIVPAPAAAEVIVQPPLADWQRANHCSLWEKLQDEHGPLIALRISGQHRWWELDDLARVAAGAQQNRPPERRGLWLSVEARYTVTRREYLSGIAASLDRAGALDRLEVREVPAGCSHATCRRQRGLPPLPRAERPASRTPAFEPLPLRAPLLGFAEVIDQYPALNGNGFGYDYGYLHRDERRRRLEEHRQHLISREEIVEQVHDWLVANIAPIKTPNMGSYGLKHLAEDLLGYYITNGELITAALMAGYPMRREDGPNALFAMSSRDVDRLHKQREQARQGASAR